MLKHMLKFIRNYRAVRNWPQKLKWMEESSNKVKKRDENVNYDEVWPKKVETKFENVYDVIHEKYVKNIKYMPDPDIILDPWLAPANETTKWLFLSAKRNGTAFAETIIQQHPNLTKFTTDRMIHNPNRILQDCYYLLFDALIDEDIDKAVESLQKLLYLNKEVPHEAIMGLIEKIASTETLQTYKKNKNYKNWPSYVKICSVLSTEEIPILYYQSYFIGSFKKLLLSDDKKDITLLNPIFEKIITSNEILSPSFLKAMLQIDKLFRNIGINSYLTLNLFTRFISKSYIPPIDVIENIYTRLDLNQLLFCYNAYQKFYKNKNSGLKMHCYILHSLRERTNEISQIKFFMYAIQNIGVEDCCDEINLFNFLLDGIDLLVKNNLYNCLIRVYETIHKLGIFLHLQRNGDFLIQKGFDCITKQDDIEKTMYFLELCQKLPIRHSDIVSKMSSYFIEKSNKDFLRFFKIILDWNFDHVKYYYQIFLVDILFDFARKIHILEKEADSLINLIDEIKRKKFGDIYSDSNTIRRVSSGSLYIKLLCSVGCGKLDQTKYLIETNFHLIDNTLWEPLIEQSLYHPPLYTANILCLIGNYYDGNIDMLIEKVCVMKAVNPEKIYELTRIYDKLRIK